MPLSGKEDDLCQVLGALFQAGYERKGPSRDALCWAADVIQASGYGALPLFGQLAKGAQWRITAASALRLLR